MADCGKTVDFIHERERMCNFYKNCEGCPATDLVAEDTMLCAAYEDDFINDVISVVQKWSDEHPAPKTKTYADDFFEKFPKASKCYFNEKDYVNGNGFPEVKRCSVYGVGIHGCKELSCTREAQMKCWNEPYEEGE